MAFKIVKCEVRWIACIGYSGTELPPSTYETIGEYETERDADQAMADAGMTRVSYGWRGEYATGFVNRILKELNDD